MIKKYGLLCVILSIMLAISGCGCSGGNIVVEKSVKRKPATGDSWTVMIYMSASAMEDEYNRAGEVLGSLSYDLPENINVVVETGGCKEWSISGVRNDKIQDFAVQKNGIRLIDEMPLKNMGSSSTYKDFLVRTIERYPADNYISVIWGDGGGPLSGAACDSAYEFDALTLNEISSALAGINTKLDIIGFDSSLMSGIETASALSLYADYLVASEDIMPFCGWDYRGLFEYIRENPQATAAEVGKVICDGVINHASDEEKEQTVMAVTELTNITKLIQSFDGLSRHMSYESENAEKLRPMTEAIADAEYMGANSPWEGYSNIVDLSSLSQAVFGVTKSDLARIDNIISKTVIYKTSGKSRKNSCGMSVYYPVNKRASEISEYKKICPSSGYKEYIDRTSTNELIQSRTADYKETASWQYYNSVVGENTIWASAYLNGNYTLSVTTPQIIARAGVNIYKYDEEEGRYLYLSTDYNTSYSTAVNGYEYELVNKQLELNGVPVASYLVSGGADYEIYSIPVIYDGEISSVRIIKTQNGEKNEYKVLGIWGGIGKVTGLADRKFKMPDVGDTITPIYSVYGEDSSKYIEGKRMTLVFGGLSIKEKSVTDGDYIISYTVEDMYGQKTESNTTTVTAIKGKLKITN